MIKITDTEVFGWKAAVRGLRNPMNSWHKSDSDFSCRGCDGCFYKDSRNKEETVHYTDIWCEHTALRIGDNDLKLMQSLAKAGDDHAKFLRMIHVQADITAPRYWWTEYDTYKVGTVANSCSTMHKLPDKEFTLDDFSHEQLTDEWDNEHTNGYDHSNSIVYYNHEYGNTPEDILVFLVEGLNHYRKMFVETNDERYWEYMIQMLPQSYNQRRTVDLNYQVLAHMYFARRNHKLSEWHEFCEWVEGLPYFKVIVIQEGEDGEKRLS